MVKVVSPEALTRVFGLNPFSFNFRGEDFGVIELNGPFVFKWSMYDTLDASGPLEGSVSISVGSYIEYSRMGNDVIKSSKCHPDAIRASSIKYPAEKKARTTSTARPEKAKPASKAPAQAMERLQRQARSMGISAYSSASESTSDDIDARRSTSQPPQISS
jgi:hypothetical protein